MKQIILLGDSIFDNASYVAKGESVIEILSADLDNDAKVILLAVDGDVTLDVLSQVQKSPKGDSIFVVSCGGNDALGHISLLERGVATVSEAMSLLANVISKFKADYQVMLKAVLAKNTKVVVCTVYNSIPNMSVEALSVLALFNEAILLEAASNYIPVIDLRVVCSQPEDYSTISPIEPSGQGSIKICKQIERVFVTHDFGADQSRIYA